MKQHCRQLVEAQGDDEQAARFSAAVAMLFRREGKATEQWIADAGYDWVSKYFCPPGNMSDPLVKDWITEPRVPDEYV